MRRLLPLVAIALVVVGCGSSKPKDAILRVGSEWVTRPQYDGLLGRARAYYKTQNKPFPAPGSAERKKLRDDIVKRLIQGAIFVQEADANKVGVSDRDVDNAIETLKQEQYNGSDDRLQQALNEVGLTMTEFRREEKVQLAEQEIQGQVTSKVRVSDAQARAYYDAHHDEFKASESRPVRHILVKTEAEAEAIYARIKAGASFQTMMERYSTDTASKQGTGKMTDTRGLFVPAFEKVSFALKTGEVSKPVHTQFGWHIIQALGAVTPATVKPFAEVKDQVKSILRPTKQQKALKAFTDALYARYCDGKIRYEPGWSSTFCH